MKRARLILITVLIFFLALRMALSPLAIFIAKSQLKKLLPGSSVAIDGCSVNPFRQLSFSGVQVSKKPLYDFKIKQAQIYFSLASILKGLKVNPWELIESCQINIDSLEMNQVSLESGYLKATRGHDDGVIKVNKVKVGKLNIKDIRGKARLEDGYLFLDLLTAELLGGHLEGDSRIKLAGSVTYQMKLNFFDLDLDTFMKDFEFKEKAEVSGKVSGLLKLQGQMREVVILDGKLSIGKDGGTLFIKDARFLENLARSSGQALDLVVESFKNYRYNIGITNISLQDNNIVFLIDLDGSAGKRSLNITLHDFNPRRAQ